MGTFLEDHNALNNENAPGFPSEPRSTPTVALSRCRLTRVYRLYGPPEPKIIYSTSPGPALPTDATPRTRSVLGGPSPRRRNASGFRRTFEAQGLGARIARRARTATSRPRSTPAMSTWSSYPGGINLADIRDPVPGSSVGNSSFWRALAVR